MYSTSKSNENISPNIDSKEEKKMKSALSWSLILNSADSSSGSTSNKRRKRSVSRCKPGVQHNSSIYSSSVVSPSNQSNTSLSLNSCISSKTNKENLLKKRREWIQNFQINRIFFEEFPIYRKEYQYPSNCQQKDTHDAEFDDSSGNYIRESLKLIPRRFKIESEQTNNLYLTFFENKKVCLLGDEEYLYHSKRQLILKLRWYGAKTLDYYSSRADYVICPSTYNEVMRKLKDLSILKEKGDKDFIQKLQIDRDTNGVQFENLRGVRIGQQIKLTELELLEFVGEDFEIALNMINISESVRNTWNHLENSHSKMKIEISRPKTMWEFIGNKDCADELYNSLLCLRLQSEDEDVLKKQGIIHQSLSDSDEFHRSRQIEALNDESCGIFVLISPGNVGSQVCAELVALGCGYDIKIYRGSDVVEPIVKQWKKGHFFKLFENSESPPICTIMTDCSGVIKSGDILKIKNSYYSSLFLRDETCGSSTGNHKARREKSVKSQKHPVNTKVDSWENPQETKLIVKKQNPGAILFILEETSETAQFFLSHCNNSSKSFGCNRSYTLYKLDGGFSTGQVIKVVRFNNLTKSAVACKLYTRFKNPTLLSILIGKFGPNIIKASQIMHWIHLIDSIDLSNILSCISLSYTPILFDSIMEIPLLMIQKCLLNQEEMTMREEIWSFSSFGLIEDQTGTFEVLLKVMHDLVTSIIACLDLTEENNNNNIEDLELKPEESPNYSLGFESPRIMMNESSQSSKSFTYAKFLHDLTDMDSIYQIEKFPHLVFHSSGNSSQQSQNQLNQSQSQLQIQQCDQKAICESYFTTLYSISLFNLVAILKQNIPIELLYSEKVINLVNDKLLKYSPINTGYDKNLTNYYFNKKQEYLSCWKYMEYLFLKQAGKSNSIVTWRSASIDSSIPNLYYKRKVCQAKYYDIVAYVPSKIPKLSIRIPDLLKHS